MELQSIISSIKWQNKSKKILFANPNDQRILDAIKILLTEGHSPMICWSNDDFSRYKNINVEKIENTSWESNNIFAAQLLDQWKVDGMISGNLSPTADVVKALLKNVWSKENVSRISSYFLMDTKLGLYIVADAAIQANPNADQLAEIALLSARSAVRYWIEPRIAMLSFSTAGSALHEMVTKVQEATKKASLLLEKNNIEALIEWELQLDAAIVPEVAISKMPNSLLKWRANILIFPDLNSGNIGYKLMQRFWWAKAIGPIIQWLNKPGNDLSRGCCIEDILDLYYITANT